MARFSTSSCIAAVRRMSATSSALFTAFNGSIRSVASRTSSPTRRRSSAAPEPCTIWFSATSPMARKPRCMISRATNSAS